MKKILISIQLALVLITVHGQTKTSQNVVVVTMDGLRWQEIFGGADSLLTYDTSAEYSTSFIKKKFWKENKDERRKTLMPFLWTEVASKGMILGSREFENHFENANPYWFSYPGYNEIFTGYPDTAVNSNDKIPNKNESVLEYLNKQPAFKNKVAVFGSWDVFSSIFNEKRSGIPVNDGFKDAPKGLSSTLDLYSRLQHELPDLFHGGERLDAATFNMGFEYMKVKKPRVIFFGLGDTDEFAHGGQYDFYLDAANQSDAWIKKLWDYIQSTPQYANKTTLIITTDHGRGDAREGQWKHHGSEIAGANQMWMAAIGPSIPASGEIREPGKANQGQIAATIGEILGVPFKPKHQPLPALKFAEK